MDRNLRYFKKQVTYFFDYEGERMPTDAEIEILYKYCKYQRDSSYHNIIDTEKLWQEHFKAKPTASAEQIKEGFEIAATLFEHTMAEKNKQIRFLKDQVTYEKNKATNLAKDIVCKVHKYEQKLKGNCKLALMDLAFKAGQKSVEGLLKPKNFGDGEPYVKVRSTYNFRTWANKVWKYGKAHLETNNNHKLLQDELEEELIPLPNEPRREAERIVLPQRRVNIDRAVPAPNARRVGQVIQPFLAAG